RGEHLGGEPLDTARAAQAHLGDGFGDFRLDGDGAKLRGHGGDFEDFLFTPDGGFLEVRTAPSRLLSAELAGTRDGARLSPERVEVRHAPVAPVVQRVDFNLRAGDVTGGEVPLLEGVALLASTDILVGLDSLQDGLDFDTSREP